MTKVVRINEEEHHYILDHKELRLEIGEENKTESKRDQFEPQMGVYNKEKDCWIFASPIDAIRVFQQI